MNNLLDRFIRYVKVDTTSCENSTTYPTTSKQMNLLRMLEQELKDIGMQEVELSEFGVLYGNLPGENSSPVIGLIAHVDTSPDAPGNNVVPILHRKWDGSTIELSNGVCINPALTEDMNRYVGETIITSDGRTLLGADDKAGVAVIIEMCDYLIKNPSVPRPALKVAFTPDEEVGKGVDNFDVERFAADLAYTVDGGPLGKIDTQTFNGYKVVWKIRGKQVHPGKAKGIMINSIRIAADLIGLLRSEEMPENTEGLEGYEYPHRITGVTGDTTVELILRDFDFEDLKNRLTRMKSIQNYLLAAYPGSEVILESREQYRNPGDIISRDKRLVDYALEGSGRIGIKAREGAIRGGTDGSRLSYMGLPTVNLPTGGELFHSKSEWISQKGLELSFQTLLRTLEVWAEENRKGEP